MFFVLKSLFWLGLVFLIAPSHGPQDAQRREAGREVGRLAAQATAEAADAIAGSLPAAALEMCRQAPRACLDGALQLQGGDKRAKAPGPAKRVSVDTLTGADREPGWRGHKAAQRQI